MAYHAYYLEEHGRRVRIPSVTQCLKQIGWSTDGLLFWANRAGLEGQTLEDARRSAADVGTIAHACIAADARGQTMPSLDRLDDVIRNAVERSLEAWRRWKLRMHMTVLAAETSLVSSRWRYGGTLDAAIVDDRVSLLDYKTGKACYPDHVCQLAAYGMLWNEHHPEQPVADYHLIRLSKEDASFHLHSWPAAAMEAAWKAFRCALVLERCEKQIKAQL